MSGNDFLDLLFDTHHPGFIHVSELILSYLDFESFVRFKRTCRFIYNFIDDRPYLEKSSLHQKLASDWRGEPTVQNFDTEDIVSHAKFFDEGRRVACAVGVEVRVFDVSSGDLNLTLVGPHSATVTSVEVVSWGKDEVEGDDSKESTYFATGCREGVLAVWDMKGRCLVRKQLFGRILSIRWKNPHLATAHFGKPYDAGCVSIRELKSVDEMPVVFSLYEDLFPVVTLDFTRDLVAALEWTGTFHGVEAGHVFIYKWHCKQVLADLSEISSCSFSTVRFINDKYLLTGGHDKLVRLWQISNSQTEFKISCTRVLMHHTDILTRMEICEDRAVTRDLSGRVIVWDLKRVMKPEGSEVIIEFLSRQNLISTVTIDLRHLLIGLRLGFKVFQFWNSENRKNSNPIAT